MSREREREREIKGYLRKSCNGYSCFEIHGKEAEDIELLLSCIYPHYNKKIESLINFDYIKWYINEASFLSLFLLWFLNCSFGVCMEVYFEIIENYLEESKD